jgi:hypothetical protein
VKSRGNATRHGGFIRLAARQQLKAFVAGLSAGVGQQQEQQVQAVKELQRQGAIQAASLQTANQLRVQLAALEESAKSLEADIQASRFEAELAQWPAKYQDLARNLLIERIQFVATVVLDVVQTIADFAGLIPVYGDAVDVVSGIVRQSLRPQTA